MGLDMYLKKKIYIGAEYKHNQIAGKIELTKNGKPINIDLTKVNEIIESVGYWRKANQIHNWFVTNVQEDNDDCEEYYVEFKKLLELKELCLEVLKTKKSDALPTVSGFFFGSTDIDEYYYQDLEDTVKILESLDENGEYYYRASW